MRKIITIFVMIILLASCSKENKRNSMRERAMKNIKHKSTNVDNTVVEESSPHTFVSGRYKMVLIYDGEYQRTWIGSFDISNLEYVALYNEDDGNVTIMNEDEYILIREVENSKFNMLYLDKGNVRRRWLGTYNLMKLDYPVLTDEKSSTSTVVNSQPVLIITKL